MQITMLALLAAAVAAPVFAESEACPLGLVDKRAEEAEGKCCFSLTARGLPSHPSPLIVGQLFDGQNRINQFNLPIPQGSYCLPIHGGGIYDSKHRGCILTPPTTQWQCDEGAKPTPGFKISNNGTLLHGAEGGKAGSGTWWSCPTGDHGGWNLYSVPVKGQLKCVPVWLEADNCFSACQ
nr:hypothetical protein B0A51_12043 [Rachicladosporium sp. CCFEE 5018]